MACAFNLTTPLCLTKAELSKVLYHIVWMSLFSGVGTLHPIRKTTKSLSSTIGPDAYIPDSGTSSIPAKRSRSTMPPSNGGTARENVS